MYKAEMEQEENSSVSSDISAGSPEPNGGFTSLSMNKKYGSKLETDQSTIERGTEAGKAKTLQQTTINFSVDLNKK